METGLTIGLFTTESERLNTSRGYRILFQGNSIKPAKSAAEDKYLSHNAEEKHKERAFEEVRSDFQPEQTRLSKRDWETDEDEADADSE